MMQTRHEIKTFTPTSLLLLCFMIAGFGGAMYRMVTGLGAPVTNLNDSVPWGFWLAFDVMGGEAMATGGFIITCGVYLFNWQRYRPIVRPALFTAFLGYILAVAAVFLDIGHPFRLWHPAVMWQGSSVMWLISMAVIFYLLVLAVEVSPMFFERLRWEQALARVKKVTLAVVILGVMICALHQSFLGALFLIAQAKMSPLWYSVLLPYHFLFLAIAMGLAMVGIEFYLSSKLFKHPVNSEILFGLSRGVVITLSLYLLLKVVHLLTAHSLSGVFAGSIEGNMFLLEMLIGILLPLGLFFKKSIRQDVRALFCINILVVTGVLLNRMNIAVFSMDSYIRAQGDGYFPTTNEFLVTLGLISAGFFMFKLGAKHLPLFNEAHAPQQD
jgi:Ni/Fe-hydrogenase subunit HybB-like protein